MSSSRAAIVREGVFERFGDEGTAVSQEDVLELQGDPSEWGGARYLLQDAETQTKAGLEPGMSVYAMAMVKRGRIVRKDFLRLREIADFVEHKQRQG